MTPEEGKQGWVAPLDEKRGSMLRVALEKASGCVTHAARDLGLSLAHVKRLLKEHELTEFARGLRVEAGAKRRQDGRVLGPMPGSKRKRSS